MRSAENEQIVGTFRRVLRRRKRWVIASFAIAVAIALAYVQLVTPEYQAAVSILVQESAPAVGATPQSTAYSEAKRIADRLAEIGSYTVAEAVAAALPETVRSSILSWEKSPTVDAPRTLATRIQESVAAQSLPGSNVVRIAVRMRDPEICSLVANTYGEVLVERSLRAKREGTSGARTFIESQLERQSAELQTSERELMQFKQRNALTSFDDEAKEVLRRTTEAEVLYNTTGANRRAAMDRLAAVQKELESQRKGLVPRVTDVATPWALRLKQKLVDLQVEYQELRVQGYPANHPKLVELEQDIAETKANLTTEAQKLAAGEISLDPLSQIDKYVNEAVALRMEVEAIGAQQTALRRVIDDYNIRLSDLPAKEFDLVRMTRDRDVNQRIYTMLQEKLQQARISEAEQAPDVRTIDAALTPLDPVKPQKKVTLALAGFLGILLGTGLAFAREGLGSTIDSSQSFERLAGWGVLVSVPRVERIVDDPTLDSVADRRERRRVLRALVVHHDRASGPAEAYRMLRTRLQLAGLGERIRVLLVTSMLPNEGKTTTVSNLAIATADLGYPTLLIDGEIRKPGMHTIFRVRREPGLAELLRAQNGSGGAHAGAPSHGRTVPLPIQGGGGAAHDSASRAPAHWREEPTQAADKLQSIESILQPTFVPNLTVLASGVPGFEAAQAISTEAPHLKQLFDAMRARFRVVLIDAPPMALVHDVTLLASLVDGVLLVVDSRNLDRDMLSDCKHALESARANVLGVVLNHVERGGVYRKNRYYTS